VTTGAAGGAAASRAASAAVRGQVLRVLDGASPAPIVQAGHPVLRAKALAYDGQLSGEELTALLDLMRATMREAPGVGLAAPQIGISLAIAVVEDPGPLDPELAAERERLPLRYRVLINPRYRAVGTERVGFYEGCLSVHGWQAVVSRPRRVRLTGSDERGRAFDEELVGWQARIVQHETDHLAGGLYVDRAEMRSLASVDNLAALWAAEPHPTMAARVLGFTLD
jgi:peptide deformylase